MVRSMPGVSGQFEFDLGESQEGGKTRQTGGRCLILRLRAQVGGLPCRLPPAACPGLPVCLPACLRAPLMHLQLPLQPASSPIQPSPRPSHPPLHLTSTSTAPVQLREKNAEDT